MVDNVPDMVALPLERYPAGHGRPIAALDRDVADLAAVVGG